MKKLVYLIIFFLYSTVMNAQLKDLVQYVNTLQGTDSNFIIKTKGDLKV